MRPALLHPRHALQASHAEHTLQALLSGRRLRPLRRPLRRLGWRRHLACLAAVSAALVLSACDKSGPNSAGQKVDASIQRVEQKVGEIRAEAGREVNEARQAASAAMGEAKQSASDATVRVSSAITDAAITTSVKAKLAVESGLDASQINVETANGRVSLQGSVVNLPAITRAGDIAAAVNGVTAVDNRLLVRG